MKRILSLMLTAVVLCIMTAAVSAVEILPAELQGKIEFGIRKAVTDWAADGEKSAGEYYDVEYSTQWCVGVCDDASESDTAQSLPVDLAMSWDEDYVYLWLSYTEDTGHNFTVAEHPSYWDGEIVQLGFADMDVVPGEATDRLETGYGMYSDTSQKMTMNWASPQGAPVQGYGADNSAVEDFGCFVNGKTVTYEIRVPINAITENNAEVGYRFKFCSVICYDGGGGSYNMWSLGDGITGGPKDAYQHVNVTMESASGEVYEDNRGKVLKGTPKLDGVLDSIYLRSNVNTIENDLVNYAWGGAAVQDFSDAASYFLWDENYLYICTVNTDSTRVNLTGEKDWKNDAAEMWFIDEDLRYKIHAAADGNFFLGGDGDGETAFDFADAKSAAAYTEDGWCVEVALPLNNLKIGREFSYSLQVNNVINDDASAGSASGSQQADYPMVCVAYAATDNPEQLPESVAGKFGFTVQEAVTGWNPDGVKSAGEYYDIDYLPEWCVGVCHDISLAYAARALPVDVAMSWDDEYVYTWLSYTEETGHHFTAAEHPSFWDGEIVQLGFAEIDATYMDLTNRLETGYGMYSDSRERTTINWADGRGTGYAA
ncbi:MAG: hypothetical protein II979_10125, partial [Clostridia bacterium]|nr:hypothetical protein [Clostridia bacterium]